MTITKDKLVQSVQEKMALRANTGILKYKNTMADVTMNNTDALKNLQEELLDGAVYIEKLLWNLGKNSLN